MTTYVALLRGINVGGNNKVEMAKLKTCFVALGYENVRTYINSGNVIFSTKNKDVVAITEIIEKAIKKIVGFEVRVVVRSSVNIAKVTKAVPEEWTHTALQKTNILFLWSEYDNKNSVKIINPIPHIDHVLYVGGAIIWHIQANDYGKSSMHAFIGSPLYKYVTVRNVNTLRKLDELMKTI